MANKYVGCFKRSHSSGGLASDAVVLFPEYYSTIRKLVLLDTDEVKNKKCDNDFPYFHDSHII